MKLWVIVLFTTLCAAQNGTPLNKLDPTKYSKDQRIRMADSIIAIKEANNNDSLPYYYQDYAYWIYDEGERLKAAELESKALNLAKQSSIQDQAFIQKSALYLGYYYAQLNETRKAIEAYNEVLLINNKNDNASKAHQQLGYNYLALQDFYRAIFHLGQTEKDLRLNNKRLGNLFTVYINLIFVNRRLNEPKSLSEAKKYIQSADSLLKIVNLPSQKKYEFYLNAAQVYNQYQTLNIPVASNYYNKALNIAKSNSDSSKIKDIYIELGLLYNTTNLDQALFHLEKASDYTTKEDSLGQFYIHYAKGFAYSHFDEFELASRNGEQALDYILPNKNAIISGDSKYLSKSKYKTQILDISSQLAETYLSFYNEDTQQKNLDKSMQCFALADRILEEINLESNEFRSRLFWRKISADIYGKAIKASYLNDDVEKGFYYAEKNKSVLLMEDIAREKSKRISIVPDILLKRETSLKKEILDINKNLADSKLEGRNASEIETKLVSSKAALQQLNDSISEYSPGINFEPKISSIHDLRANLKENEIVFEYHISRDDGFGTFSNNENAYLFIVETEGIEFIEIPNLQTLENQVRNLISLMKRPVTSESDFNEYLNLSWSTYQLLFPSVEIQEKIRGKKVTIVPDSFLSFLPFEALSDSKSEPNYLIEDSEFHYLYSYSFLDQTNEITTNKDFLGMAPITFKDASLGTLENSRSEIESLEQYYSGLSFMESNATKGNFTKNLGRAGIIHLATHASAQDSVAPWIAFSNEKLYLDELYLSPNKASLVVLSGCNTTVGKEETGEGIMSLARGFFYSGSKSVISTLWSIDDRSSAELIDVFYANLKKGQTKSQALHNAKLQYLETHSFSEASPHFWASYVLIGANDTLPSSSFPWWIVIIAGILLFGIFFIRKLRKSR